MTDINETKQAADRTAARLLAQWPDTDLNNNDLIIDRCLEFKTDLRAGHGCAFGLENVRQAGIGYQLLASVSANTYDLDELHKHANKLYAADQKIEEQSHQFFAAQAVYRLAAVAVQNGH